MPARGDGELAVTVIVAGSDLYLHAGVYSPPVFGVAGGGARLAVVGGGREAAAAKHSEWVRSVLGLFWVFGDVGIDGFRVCCVLGFGGVWRS